MTDLKAELHRQLRVARTRVLSRVDGLSEYAMRRPMTPTATNLLGLVKHLAGVEYGYLGEAFGRPPAESLPWVDDGSIWDGADMWATPQESSASIIGLYRRACDHGDATIDALDLDSTGSVAHWPEERRSTTLGALLVRMVAETAQHAGHADVVRELIDGKAGPEGDDAGDVDDDTWRDYFTAVKVAADEFRVDGDDGPATA